MLRDCTKPNNVSPLKDQQDKFSKIRSTIDTGLHVGNVKVIPFRQGESFRRLKSSELASLIQLSQEPQESIFKLIPKCDENDINNNTNNNNGNTSNDNNNNNNNGNENGGNMETHSPSKEERKSQMESNIVFYNKEELSDDAVALSSHIQSPYLLLDIRTPEQYQLYHIQTSILYDPLSVRQDRIGKQLYDYKNKENKIIVVSSDDELQATKFCQSLIEKYFDNIFLLSMSVQRFCSKYRHLANGNKLPNVPNPFSPKKIQYRNSMNSKMTKSNTKSSKLNQANLNLKNKQNNQNNQNKNSGNNTQQLSTSSSRIEMDNQSNYSKSSRMTTMSTRTWLP